jgi:hypothetical protein
MINDPGRQFFEDQVQFQGFLFLDEYLDNIWAAAKQEYAIMPFRSAFLTQIKLFR